MMTSDTRALIIYESRKKSAGVSYVLWFFLGFLGAHRFYNRRFGTGIALVALTVIGWLLVAMGGRGVLFVQPAWILLLVDLFLIPGWVRMHNLTLIGALEGAATPLALERAAL